MYNFMIESTDGTRHVVATDAKIKTVLGFIRIFPSAIFGTASNLRGIDGLRRAGYTYAEVQKQNSDDYTVIDSICID